MYYTNMWGMIVKQVKLFNVHSFFYDENHYEMQHRILNIFIITAFFVCIVCSLANLLVGLNFFTIVVPLVCGLIALYCAYLSLNKNLYKLPAYIMFFTFSLILFPVMFLYNGGILGAMPFFLIVYGTIVFIFISPNKRVLFFSFFLILILLLIAIENQYPSIVTTYSSDSERVIDISISLFIAIIINTYLMYMVVKNYDIQHNKAEELSLQLLKEKKKYEMMSKIDDLTQLYNYRYCMEYIAKIIYDCKRSNKKFSIIFFDLDNFKKINDVNGHVLGDHVLRVVGQNILNNLSEHDFVARYGGEEFISILPNKKLSEAYEIADLIRTKISEINLVDCIKVTISGGVVEYNNEEIDELISNVDKLLYKAKRLGKNRIEK